MAAPAVANGCPAEMAASLLAFDRSTGLLARLVVLERELRVARQNYTAAIGAPGANVPSATTSENTQSRKAWIAGSSRRACGYATE